MHLTLGSASPRRLDLLKQIGLVPDAIRAAEIDETPQARELPRIYARRMALAKLHAIDSDAGSLLLTADTIVAVGRRILGKPFDAVQARGYLALLSGRRHRVITAVALRRNTEVWRKEVATSVKFKRLSKQEIDRYMASQEWQGKAGGYAIQGLAGAFIPSINGSYSNVVGLPLAETAGLLQATGYKLQSDKAIL